MGGGLGMTTEGTEFHRGVIFWTELAELGVDGLRRFLPTFCVAGVSM